MSWEGNVIAVCNEARVVVIRNLAHAQPASYSILRDDTEDSPPLDWMLHDRLIAATGKDVPLRVGEIECGVRTGPNTFCLYKKPAPLHRDNK